MLLIMFYHGNLKDYLLALLNRLLSLIIVLPTINYYYADKIKVKFIGSCLKQDKVIFNHGKAVSIYIVYKLGASSSSSSHPTLKNCLFGAITLTKSADI